MKAIPFAFFSFLLLSVFVLTEVSRDNHIVFDDGPFGCDYFSCDDIEVLLSPRPQCLFGNCEFEDTLWKTKYWQMKHRQG